MRQPLPILMTSLALLCSSGLTLADCRYSRDMSLDVDLDGIKRLEIHALAGELRVNGDDSNKNAKVRARLCADDEDAVEAIHVRSDSDKKVARIIAVIARKWHEHGAYIDLDIDMPDDLEVTIADTSGELSAENIALNSLADTSGEIRLREINGNLDIQDTSGDIQVRDISGKLTVSDSSGDVNVETAGSVLVQSDSSGDLLIRDIKKTVDVVSDSSGEIKIVGAGDDVSIGSDSSGDIRISKVDGHVRIGNDSSGNVLIADVKGDFSIANKGAGEIRTDNVSGDIRIRED